MNIPLNEFEQLIDESILERGFAYFKKGAVSDILIHSAGELEKSKPKMMIFNKPFVVLLK